jgi:hypothetical protein
LFWRIIAMMPRSKELLFNKWAKPIKDPTEPSQGYSGNGAGASVPGEDIGRQGEFVLFITRVCFGG